MDLPSVKGETSSRERDQFGGDFSLDGNLNGNLITERGEAEVK